MLGQMVPGKRNISFFNLIAISQSDLIVITGFPQSGENQGKIIFHDEAREKSCNFVKGEGKSKMFVKVSEKSEINLFF